MFEDLLHELNKTLIEENRWFNYADGLKNTLLMTVMASIVGIILGVIVGIIKTYNAETGKWKIANFVCSVYTTVIRGTPAVVQLLIFYHIIFINAPADMKVMIAALSFGINSGAYVAEIIRAGIQSIDRGQNEAGRSLGLNQAQTMRYIILPQAVRNILPALFNEMITLLKETSIAGYISIQDITRAGDLIRSRTFGFLPLVITALIYLVLVIGLTKVQQKMEARLRASDTR